MLMGIREILVISTPRDIDLYKDLLSDGNAWGLQISYATQIEPNGLAEAFIIGETLNNDNCPYSGDNIFYGDKLSEILINNIENDGATIFAYHVNNPRDYGVVNFNERKILEIEKPYFT